jgi:NitT/TauT family transport system substrate-binding protein
MLADLERRFPSSDLLYIDAGEPAVILAGSHIGCVELSGSDRVSTTRDLKGKRVGINRLRSDDQLFISMFVAYVGLDPQKDIHWVVYPDWRDSMRLLAEGQIDAFFVGPPFSLKWREEEIGHVLVNTTTARPWSQYFCCLIASTKRALRALLKAADVCAPAPERTAQRLIDTGMMANYEDYVLQTLKEIPYGQWREYDVEDSVRFYALWMREVGLIKSRPQQIIARGTD